MILIAGGSGFFGLTTAGNLAEKGKEVLLVQRHGIEPPSFLKPYWDKEVKQANGNILDLSFLIGMVKKILCRKHHAGCSWELWSKTGSPQPGRGPTPDVGSSDRGSHELPGGWSVDGSPPRHIHKLRGSL